MKRILIAVAALLLTFTGARSEEPTLDTSSLAAFKASVTAMTEALPDEKQRRAFNNAWFALALPAKDSSMQGLVDALKPYAGKTAVEIIDGARAAGAKP